ncbi:hypothetical protein ACFVUH_20410 [Kitasatospora sp. NPDC058032]|uniref:hypothetical protein n=1 Tax=unclassified Kitasatospora TaxID=2633591 RepID=UPI0033A9BE7D
MSCSHWNVRVTVPQGWQHVGLLPAGGPLFEDGRPLDEWGKGLKAVWADLTNLSRIHGDER